MRTEDIGCTAAAGRARRPRRRSRRPADRCPRMRRPPRPRRRRARRRSRRAPRSPRSTTSGRRDGSRGVAASTPACALISRSTRSTSYAMVVRCPSVPGRATVEIEPGRHRVVRGLGRAREPGQDRTGHADAAAPRAGRTSPACGRARTASASSTSAGPSHALPVASGRRQVSSAQAGVPQALGERTADRGGWALPPFNDETRAAPRVRRPRRTGPRNPDPESTLPYLLRLPLTGGMVFRTAGTWPLTKALFCYPVSVDEWPADPESWNEPGSALACGAAPPSTSSSTAAGEPLPDRVHQGPRPRRGLLRGAAPVPHPPERWYPASGQTASGPADAPTDRGSPEPVEQ